MTRMRGRDDVPPRGSKDKRQECGGDGTSSSAEALSSPATSGTSVSAPRSTRASGSYATARKRIKRGIAEDIVRDIRRRGGRFLIEDRRAVRKSRKGKVARGQGVGICGSGADVREGAATAEGEGLRSGRGRLGVAVGLVGDREEFKPRGRPRVRWREENSTTPPSDLPNQTLPPDCRCQMSGAGSQVLAQVKVWAPGTEGLQTGTP